MPLVMVHGVATRDSPAYRAGVEKQRHFFSALALRGLASDPLILHPYWGGFGAKPAWGGASLPSGNFEAFGAEDDIAKALEEIAPGFEGQHPLLELARANLVDAVDLLWVSIPANRANGEVAELGGKTEAYAEEHPSPPWLSEVSNDQQFLTRLMVEVEGWQVEPAQPASAGDWESFGLADVWDRVREGASRLASAPAQLLGSALVAAGRANTQRAVGMFVGDVLVYLSARDGQDGQPGPIPQVVIDALERAANAVSDADPYLIVVGHSMGGDILYDILTNYRPELKVDAFMTVGSQVSFFEELKLFHASQAGVPSVADPKVSVRPGVRHWVNLLDRQDIVSYSAEAIFDRVTDFEYNTGASVLGAHTAYFERPSFHRRLNERLKEVLLA